MINAKVIADSKNEFGNRITTMVVTFPRIILAEFNTHRMFSKNSASSRAIPFKKILKSVQENPFIPAAFQKDHAGMQGTEYLSNTEKYGLLSFIAALTDLLNASLDKESKEYLKLKEELEEKIELISTILKPYSYEEKTLIEWWLFARDKAVEAACIMYVFKVTKQLCNRLLEPFMWHIVIVTATEWENFFALRCPQYAFRGKGESGEYDYSVRSKKDWITNFKKEHPAQKVPDCNWFTLNKGQAEIHMMALAEAMWDAYQESTPKELKAGEWHIPFGDQIDATALFNLIDPHSDLDVSHDTLIKLASETAIKIATARCARVSYTVVGEEGKLDNYENDIKLHDRLAASGHWSPMEHCARTMSKGDLPKSDTRWLNDIGFEYGWSGNFRGFIQYRKMFNNENITV